MWPQFPYLRGVVRLTFSIFRIPVLIDSTGWRVYTWALILWGQYQNCHFTEGSERDISEVTQLVNKWQNWDSDPAPGSRRCVIAGSLYPVWTSLSTWIQGLGCCEDGWDSEMLSQVGRRESIITGVQVPLAFSSRVTGSRLSPQCPLPA